MSEFDLNSFDFSDLSKVPPPERLSDDSGKPCPTTAFAITRESFRIPVDMYYDGIEPTDGSRRYVLKVEMRWIDMQLSAFELDRLPPDVRIVFKHPKETTDEQFAVFNTLVGFIDWIIGGETAKRSQGRLPAVGTETIVRYN